MVGTRLPYFPMQVEPPPELRNSRPNKFTTHPLQHIVLLSKSALSRSKQQAAHCDFAEAACYLWVVPWDKRLVLQASAMELAYPSRDLQAVALAKRHAVAQHNSEAGED